MKAETATSPAIEGHKRFKARHWIISGICSVLILHLVGFLLSRGILLAQLAKVSISPHVHMAVISIQLTAVVAWIYLPFALFLLRRATLLGKGGFRRAATIGFTLTAASWCVVAPLTQMLITSLIGVSILSGIAIGMITWLLLLISVPEAEMSGESGSSAA